MPLSGDGRKVWRIIDDMRVKIHRYRNVLQWLALAAIAASVLTACTVSVSGGILGALGSLGLLGCLLFLVGVTQSGCIEDPPGRDDAEVRDGGLLDVGPCLRGPRPAEDMHLDMRAQPDAGIGPCLGAPLPDRGAQMDAGPPDARVGPCLDVPPEPEPPGKALQLDRDAIFEKIAQGLPADVVARLVPPPTDV